MPSEAPAREMVMMSLSTVAGRLGGTLAVAAGLEADGVDRGVDLGLAEDACSIRSVQRCRPC